MIYGQLTLSKEKESVEKLLDVFIEVLRKTLSLDINHTNYHDYQGQYRDITHRIYKGLLDSFESHSIAQDFGHYEPRGLFSADANVREFRDRLHRDLSCLEYLRKNAGKDTTASASPVIASPGPGSGNSVFVVHGHDKARRDEVELLLHKLELTPIILQDKPSKGNTMIEKFEEHADEIGFAIALFTADDKGRANNERKYNPRARQNVIFELGYFYARLERRNTAVLLDSAIEIPSDIQGIVRIQFSNPQWKAELVREFKAANLKGSWDKFI